LAAVNISKGKTEVARVFLKALAKDLWHHNRAMKMLRHLDDDPARAREEANRYLRSSVLTRTAGELPFELESRCLMLLRGDQSNRMAFEYLMTCYLINRDLPKFVRHFPRLGDFGYPAIPRVYEEALLLYQMTTGRTVSLPGYAIRSETGDRFADFQSRVVPFQERGDARGARESAAASHGNSYFFYYVFGECGVGEP
jgi:hypothetical protein